VSSEFQRALTEAIPTFRRTYESFEDAYASYTAQYGESAINVHDATQISNTIDPVIVILGRNTPLLYRDSDQTIEGSLSRAHLEPSRLYILGRREPLDSKLMIWGPNWEREITQYDSRVHIVPSRIHAAIWFRDLGVVHFTDLGSSSGSIVAGETKHPEPFIVAYATPKVDIRRIEIPSKYART
jgi:hypothetical protein